MNPDLAVRAGQRVGKYILTEQIARGGMAEVWAARAEGPQGFVKSLALKFILETFRGDADLERLFVNEARTAAQLQHANLVSVFDFDKISDGEAGELGRYYIAMERVDGHDLRRVLQVAQHKGRRVSPAIALHVVGEVLKGLRYVHERRDSSGQRVLGLVHRDVSPHNVLVGLGGEVKLSDFGIAKAMTQSLGTAEGMIRGKLAYASPEQLRGESVDHRTDQFGAGVTLWEMLAGRRLFDGADELELMGKVMRCEIPPLGVEAGVDPAVEAIARRMLSVRSGDRFPTTAEALAAVLGAPGYLADATPVGELMCDLFTAPAVAMPPTVPMNLSPPPLAANGQAETSALERSPAGTTRPPVIAAAPPERVREPGSITGSAYVSRDSPAIPTLIARSGLSGRPWLVFALVTTAVAAVGSAIVLVARRPQPRAAVTATASTTAAAGGAAPSSRRSPALPAAPIQDNRATPSRELSADSKSQPRPVGASDEQHEIGAAGSPRGIESFVRTPTPSVGPRAGASASDDRRFWHPSRSGRPRPRPDGHEGGRSAKPANPGTEDRSSPVNGAPILE